MNKKKIIQSVVASALCVAMVLSIVLGALFLMPSNTIQAASAEGNNFDFKFKKSDGSNVSISFIGDSITTYSGVSNNTSYNSTIGGNAVYYGRTSHAHYSEFADVKLADTWWMQTIDTLGLDLCVNNSWSGSKIITLGGTTATQKSNGSGYYQRCYNLHNDKTGKQPDIIVVFLGTNDCGSREDPSSSNIYGTNTLPTVDKKYTDSAWVPGTVVGAYAGMIRRICATYPNAEIYCCSLLPQQDERLSNNKQVYDKFNAGVREVIEGYSTGKDPINGTTIYKHTPGIHLVDFYNESGIHQDKQSRENCYANRLHPNKLGMDAMSNLLISELMEHSKYMPSETVDVTYDLANTFVEVGNVTSAGQAMYGDVTRAVMGKPFQVTINTKGDPNIDYRVTMGGQDITSSVVHGDTITIPLVTGDITIRAHEFDYFYWNAGKGGLESAHASDESVNANELSCYYNDGAYTVVDGAANFDSAGRAYTMAEPINLLHDRNWELEFRMSGAFNSGALLLSYSTSSDVWDIDTVNGATRGYVRENNVHLFRTSTNGMIAFGVTTERDNDKTTSNGNYADYYYHYGVGLTNASYGGNASFNVNVMHTYRMFNVYDAATGGNTIYLSIDGGTPIAMTNAATASTFGGTGSTSTYEMSGRDLTFNSMGTWDADRRNGGNASGHPLRNCRIEYIKVKENGDPVTYNHDPSNYYWEFQQSGVVSNPEGLQVFTDNKVTVAQGAYAANGNFGPNTSTQNSLKLAQPAVLLASRPWIMEYQMSGTYTGGILLTSDLTTSNQGGNSYIHMNTYAMYFGISQKHKNNHYNSNDSKGITYETIASKLGSSKGDAVVNDKLVYRLENVINPDGSNHVVLYVNDVMIGDLVQAGSDWSGKDMIINYFGSQNNYGLRNIDLDYIMIYENGIPQEKEDDEIDNFRWDATKDGMTSVKPTEENTYFTENIATIKKGSGVNGIHDLPAYYQLDKTVNLLHDRNWNIEWRASGSWGGTDNSGDDPMLLSSIGTRKKNMTYIWRNSSDLIAFGTYDSPGFSNYGIRVSDTEFGELNDGQIYTYRLENRVERDAQGNYIRNMVYLWIDGVEIGALDNYYVNNNDQNKKGEWLSGRDFAFNYIGNDAFSLLDVNFEYLQIWENGYKMDTSRLDYLIANQETRYAGVTDESWTNYQNALEAGRSVLYERTATQSLIDEAVENIILARNQLVIPSQETKIYSTELVTGDYHRTGKQVGVKVITSPDVAQVEAEVVTLITNTSKIQTMTIDGEKTVVKVWLISWKYGADYLPEDIYYTWTIGAWREYDASHYIVNDNSLNDFDVSVDMEIHFSSHFVTGITVEGELEKFVYGYKEEFDPTGLTVIAYYNNGTSKELTSDEYNVLNPILYPGDEFVTIEYQGATAEVPVTTVANVSQAHWFDFDENDASITEPPVIWVQGIYMGFVADHNSGIYEVIVKDYMSDKMMSVVYYDYDEMLMLTDNFWPGDIIWVQGNIYVDDATNKTCLINAYADSPWSYPDDFIYEPINTRTMHNQGQIDDLFQDGVIKDYQIVNFKGTMYLHRYNNGDRIYYTIHMNPDAEGWDGFGESIVQLTDDAYQTYNGESILGNLFFEASDEFNMNFEDTGEDLFPGIKVDGQITGVYVYNDGYYQLAVLDANWVSVDSVTDVTIQDAEIIE